jgi:hypothetical protein
MKGKAQATSFGVFGRQSGNGMYLSLSTSVSLTASLNETHTQSCVTADNSDPVVPATDGRWMSMEH